VDQSVSAVYDVDRISSGAGDPAATSSLVTAGPAPGRIDLPKVAVAVRHLAGSMEPARMFSQLTQVCVPALCDTCTVDMVEAAGHHYRTRQPADLSGNCQNLDPDSAIRIEFSSEGSGGPRFSGVLACLWLDGYRPSAADTALLGLLVDHTIALVEHERLAARVDELQTAAAGCGVTLPGHQRVAAAVGILMALHHLSAAQATDLLSRASQHTHQSIRGVADTVLRTGSLPEHHHQTAAWA
jgi:hypothetical protein